MATIDIKAIVDNIIKNDGYYEGDREEPRAVKIVEYTNAWGNIAWGVSFEGEFSEANRYEIETDFVRNPKVIWEAPDEP